MLCDEVGRKISAYVDGELDAASSRDLADHLDRCARCREHLCDLGSVDMLVRGLPKLHPRPGFSMRVVERARGWDAPVRKTLVSRMIDSVWSQLSEELPELLKRRKMPNIRTLDEFGDFPPLSLSCAYFQILGRRRRG